MSSYNVFAKYYDFLTENVDYDETSDFVSVLFKGSGFKTVLDLACGTGVMSEKLSKNGFDVIGIDASEDMLSIAKNRLPENTFIKAKMQDFKLNEKVDGCICCLDSINHLIDENDVIKTFKNVYDSLNDKGIFFFDVNTVYKHRTLLNDKTYVFDEEDFFLSWDNELLENDVVRIMLDFFVFNGRNYDRYSEEFFERAYSENELINMLRQSGFNDYYFCRDFDLNYPTETTERLFFICRK